MEEKTSSKFLLKYLAPLYFSYVMATEIISISLHTQHYISLSFILYILGLFGYILLIILYGLRIWKYPKDAWRDLIDIPRGFEYFSFVAGTNTLLVRALIDNNSASIMIIAMFSIIIITFLFYFIGLHLLLNNQKAISESVNPSWFLSVIALQSISIIISGLLGKNLLANEFFWLIGYGSWTTGLILYFIVLLFVLHRSFFYKISANDLHLGYWMCMGAAAISILAGSELIQYSQSSLFILNQKSLITTVVVSLWIWCTLWIPYLFIMEIYKYIILKNSVKYQISLWSMVFPLGMYSVASEVCFNLTHLNVIKFISEYWIWIAFASWVFVIWLFLIHVLSTINRNIRTRNVR